MKKITKKRIAELKKMGYDSRIEYGDEHNEYINVPVVCVYEPELTGTIDPIEDFEMIGILGREVESVEEGWVWCDKHARRKFHHIVVALDAQGCFSGVSVVHGSYSLVYEPECLVQRMFDDLDQDLNPTGHYYAILKSYNYLDATKKLPKDFYTVLSNWVRIEGFESYEGWPRPGFTVMPDSFDPRDMS